MKKVILTITLVAVATYALGLKTKGFVQKNIYIPLARRNSQKQNNDSYKEVLCPKDGIALATFGQSNSANMVKPLSTNLLPNNLLQYDWKSGKCFEYKEPLLGTTGTHGNVITYTASKIAKDTSDPVVIIPFGVAGTSILDWAYGYLSYQQDIALSSIRRSGLSPIIFLWHQGESDVRAKESSPDDLKRVPSFIRPTRHDYQLGLSRESYAEALQKVFDKTKKYFPNSYFGIALVSGCGPIPWEPVREAQREIAKNNKSAFISADSDKIYSKQTRYDLCHFSRKGAEELGNQYYNAISSLIK